MCRLVLRVRSSVSSIGRMKHSEIMSESRFLFGVHVKELREEQQLTQMQLAVISGLNRSYISRIECGRCNITLDSILLIARGLGVTPAELLDGVDSTLSGRTDLLPVVS